MEQIPCIHALYGILFPLFQFQPVINKLPEWAAGKLFQPGNAAVENISIQLQRSLSIDGRGDIPAAGSVKQCRYRLLPFIRIILILLFSIRRLFIDLQQFSQFSFSAAGCLFITVKPVGDSACQNAQSCPS